MKAWEVKLDTLFKIRFETSLQINETKWLETKKIRIKLCELNMGNLNHLITQEEYATYDPETNKFLFPRFEFTNDLMATTNPIPMKTFVIYINEVTQSKKKGPDGKFLMQEQLLGKT